MEKNRSPKLIVGVIVVLIGFGLLVWAVTGKNANAPKSESNNDTTANSSQSDVDDPDQTVSSEETVATTITFTNEGFMPSTVTVKKGTTVTVKNESNQRVQFSSDDHPTHRLNTEMNLDVLEPGESASFTAETVGTHGFHDHIDDSKTGTLVVTD